MINYFYNTLLYMNQQIQLYFNNIYLNDNKLYNLIDKTYTSTLFNNPTIGVNGPKNGLKSVQLNQSLQQYISIDPFYTQNNGITFSCWIKCDSTNGTWSRIFDFGNGPGQDNILVFINNGFLGFGVLKGTSTYQKDNLIPNILDNKWRHIVWTLDPNSGWKIYVNGELFKEFSDGFYPNSMLRNYQYLGKSNWIADPYLSGFLADFRIYNNVLNITDIQNIYNQTYPDNAGPEIKDKPLNTGFTQLYNEIFCNLFQTNNGFIQCKKCNFGEQAVYNQSTQASEQNCLNACNNEPRCTSYTYDNNAKTNNCTQYITFPHQRYETQSNVNSGYNVRKFKYDFNKLSEIQKKNVAIKCSDQFLNQYFIPNKNIDLKSCIKNSETSNLININVDPECIYNIYQKNGLNPAIVNQSNYNNNNKIMGGKSDRIIDAYQNTYNEFILKQVQNSNINNKLSSLNPNTEINDPIILAEDNSSSLNVNIKSISENIINTIGITESFENYSNSKLNYCNILIILFILSIIVILIIYLFKNK